MVPVDRVENIQMVDIGATLCRLGFHVPYNLGKTPGSACVALGFVRSFHRADLAFTKP